MEVELKQVRDFLAGYPPFDELPSEVLDGLPRSLSIRYLRRGRAFPPEDADESYVYVVRQGSLELRNERDELVAKFAEGDTFGSPCTGALDPGPLKGWAVEDTLLYLLPCARFRELRAEHPTFDLHFTQLVRDKLRRAVEALQPAGVPGGSFMTAEVRSLVGRPPVHVTPDTALRDAALKMTQERVSAILVMQDGELRGIVTDRDLRARCVAENVPALRPVREIMTVGVHTIAADALAFQAMLIMMRLGLHHLPVMDRGAVLGVLSTTDLVRQQSAHPVYLVALIRRGESVPDLVRASSRIPELQVQMVAAGTTPRHLGLAVGVIADAVTGRLLELAEAELGPPPCPYAWLAFGSQARHEQTALSDQDNGLLLAEPGPEHDGYFAALARFVNDGLAACGFSPCPGGVMASNTTWRQPLRGWRRHFESWIERPEPKALMHASIFFDMRSVAGDESLARELQACVNHMLEGREAFLAHLVANAAQHRPPLGFFRNFVLAHGGEHAETFDAKRGGVLPIVELARIHALAVGSTALETVERLRDAADRQGLSRTGADDLEHALAFVGALRARHQADQVKQGLPPDNHVRPGELSLLERSQLKDAFAVIRRHQEVLGQLYRIDRIA
jgi:CBS domain-containing protein